jgi:hypothetical protein
LNGLSQTLPEAENVSHFTIGMLSQITLLGIKSNPSVWRVAAPPSPSIKQNDREVLKNILV